MTLKRTAAISLCATLAVWGIFSWPLPRHLLSAIPAATHLDKARVETMVPGDHLQLEYYCWLAKDMMAGKTPVLRNVYEFNTGDDRLRFQPEPYYFPFSFLYAAGTLLGGRAFGWNLTGFVSLWLTYLFTWLLTRRYTSDEFIAALAGLASILVPFRWINLFGGSPAGFAMMWIPVLWYGIDRAVRDDSARGGFLAGVAVVFACWTDGHVFFFGVLSIPAWCVIAFVRREQFGWKSRDAYARLLAALLPLVLLTCIAVAFPFLLKWIALHAVGSTPAEVKPRTLDDVARCSPAWQSLFGTQGPGPWEHIYLGYVATVLLVAGGLAAAWRSSEERTKRRRLLIILGLLFIGILCIVILALGTRAPAHTSALLLALRRLIPPYCMIRQPTKIFCLIPPLLSVALAIGLTALFARARARILLLALPVVCVGLLAADYKIRVNPTISRLDTRQAAYSAVAEDAASANVAPRALVVPLWPGDSHWSSVYQYYCSLYRIRMVNGYAPFPGKTYFDRVFRRLASVNQGVLTDDQIAVLQEMNVRYVILHEDLFPEKVSPFPVTVTLENLLNHPRLRLLKQGESVWAFRLLPEPAAERKSAERWNVLGCARRWEAEVSRSKGAESVPEPSASGNRYASLGQPGEWAIASPERVSAIPDPRYLIRARGAGTLNATVTLDEESTRVPLTVRTSGWTWVEAPIPLRGVYPAVALKLENSEGSVDVDVTLLAGGAWKSPDTGGELSVPAPCFFHAGYTDLDRNSVVLRKHRVPGTVVFYGQNLPLEAGLYKVELVFRSEATPGTELGQLALRRSDRESVNWVPALAGSRCVAEYSQTENLPVCLDFRFAANADMEIDRVVFSRVK